MLWTKETKVQDGFWTDLLNCNAPWCVCYLSQTEVDSFTVSLHSPSGRHLPVVRVAQWDCQWPSKRWKFPPVSWANNSLRLRQSQPIFRPANNRRRGQPVGGHVLTPLTALRPPGKDCIAVEDWVDAAWWQETWEYQLHWDIPDHYGCSGTVPLPSFLWRHMGTMASQIQ